jgi:hypothetical protein
MKSSTWSIYLYAFFCKFIKEQDSECHNPCSCLYILKSTINTAKLVLTEDTHGIDTKLQTYHFYQ